MNPTLVPLEKGPWTSVVNALCPGRYFPVGKTRPKRKSRGLSISCKNKQEIQISPRVTSTFFTQTGAIHSFSNYVWLHFKLITYASLSVTFTNIKSCKISSIKVYDFFLKAHSITYVNRNFEIFHYISMNWFFAQYLKQQCSKCLSDLNIFVFLSHFMRALVDLIMRGANIEDFLFTFAPP